MRALVFSIDDAYVIPFKVLWHSLMKTRSVPETVPIYVLHEQSLSKSSIHDLVQYFDKYQRKATFLNASACVPNDVPISGHISKATYYRLYLASIMPREVKSVLYIDSDAIVVRSISQLFILELTHHIAAVDHLSPENSFRLWGPTSGNYFQAGVLLIDLEAWRSEDYQKEFSKVLNNDRHRILWWDQDVLNIVFENNWQRLPVWFNVCHHVRKALEPEVVSSNVCFWHLDGYQKPWKYPSNLEPARQWYISYEEAFGRPFDISAIQAHRPVWKKAGSAIKRMIKSMIPE